MVRFVLPFLVLLALIALLVVGLDRDPGYVPSPLIGKQAPAFVLPRLDDPSRQFGHADMAGDVALLNVWGTWCVGCRQEHAYLMEIARSGDVRIFGLNWKDDAALARKWLVELGNPYVSVGMDADGRVAIDWGVYGAPETFLLAADGTVLYKHIAPLTPEVWEKQFQPRIERSRSGQR